MKRMMFITLALAILVTVSITDEANAGWFTKDKNEEVDNKAHRFELFPSMSFYSGTIRRDTYAGWLLDNLSLQLVSKSSVIMDGTEKGFLQEGKSAMVMGVKYGNTLLAYRVRVMKPDYEYAQNDVVENLIPGPHPKISIGSGPH